MTVATSTYVNTYTGNGTATVYPYTFRVLDQTHLAVYVNGVLQTLTTHYTVSGVGAAGGGNITFVTAPGSGLLVKIKRNLSITQPTDYVENDAFAAATIENDIDRGVMIDQQLAEELDRTLHFADGASESDVTVPGISGQAGKYLRINSTATGIEYAALTATGTYADPVTTKGDLIRGGSTGVQERVALGTAGDGLRVDPSTGKPEWKPGMAVSLLAPAAHAAAGDVYVTDPNSDRHVTSTTTSGDRRPAVVAPAAMNTEASLFVQSGLVTTVAIQGGGNRGDYIRASSTAKKFETTYVSANGLNEPPAGACGILLTAPSVGTATVLLFGSTVGKPAPNRGYIYGLGLANNASDAASDLDIAVGECASDDTADTDRSLMVLSTALTKQLDAAWAAGTNAGGLFSGVSSSDRYDIFLIKDPTTGTVDAGYDQAGANGSHIPAAYTKKRFLGGVRAGASGILAFTHDVTRDYFRLKASILDVNATNPGLGAVTRTLSVPTGTITNPLRVTAVCHAAVRDSVAATVVLGILSDLDANSETASATAAPLAQFGCDAAGGASGSLIEVRTNHQGQIRSELNTSNANITLRIATVGWYGNQPRPA